MDQTSPESSVNRLTLYLVNVGLKRVGPVATGALVASLLALMAAHQGLLESWGITYGTWPLAWPAGQNPTGPVILIELDTVSSAALALLSSLVAAAVTMVGHQVTQTLNQGT